jgi:hypothetical protein
MGIAELKAAFNEGAGGAFTATSATLGYERHSDVQFQILTFRGTDAAGRPFERRSDRLRPETDVIVAARDLARSMVEQGEKPAP